MRRAAIIAVVVSTTAFALIVLMTPIVYSRLLLLHTQLDEETRFCRVRFF